jgi:hypothetical protein
MGLPNAKDYLKRVRLTGDDSSRLWTHRGLREVPGMVIVCGLRRRVELGLQTAHKEVVEMTAAVADCYRNLLPGFCFSDRLFSGL